MNPFNFFNPTQPTRRMIRTIGFAVCILLSSTLAAQVYTLDAAVQFALGNNKQIINDQLSSKSAMCKIGETRGALLPRLDISNQYQYYMNLPEQYAPATNFGGPEDTYTKMSLSLQQTVSMNAQITQSIINREAHLKVEAAEIGFEASKLQIALTKESITYQVSSTYYTIQVLIDNLDRIESNIDNLERIVNINSSLVQNELISSNAYNRLVINLQNLRNERENQALQIYKYTTQLKYLMHVDISDTVEVMPFDYATSFNLSIGQDLSRRPDLQLQQIMIRQSETDIKLVQAKYSPTMTAVFGSGVTSYYDEFAPGKQINDDWINNTYVAFQTKFPLFAGGQKRFQTAQSKLTLQKNVNTLSMYQLRASREVTDAWSKYNTHKSQLQNTRESLEVAESLFVSAEGDYTNGLNTVTDVLNAQNDLTDARTNYNSAMLNLKLAELDLKKAYGIL